MQNGTGQPPTLPVRYDRKRRTNRWRRRFVLGLIAAALTVLGLVKANSALGAASADFLRAGLGPAKTARLEAVYLNASDMWQQVLFRTGAKRVSAPWPVPSHATSARIPSVGLRHAVPAYGSLPVLQPLRVVVSPSLPGEGVWSSSVAPASRRDPVPLIAKAFFRPDGARPYAIATILRFNLHHVALHMVAGIGEPGGVLGNHGPGTIPLRDQRPGTLLAVLNGGFKYADGAYGMMVNGTVYVPPVQDAATVAVTRGGQVVMGAWGRIPSLRTANTHLVSWRQNESLLVANGAVNPTANNGSAWGTTVLNAAYTWRSGIGITRDGSMLYVAGNALSVSTLARTLVAAGAKTAMEMDINPYWVRAFFYGRDPRGRLTMAELRPDMQGNGADYFVGYNRDFLYVTRR